MSVPERAGDQWAQCQRCDTWFGLSPYSNADPELCTVCAAVESGEGVGDA
jgi:hypothetical protein